VLGGKLSYQSRFHCENEKEEKEKGQNLYRGRFHHTDYSQAQKEEETQKVRSIQHFTGPIGTTQTGTTIEITAAAAAATQIDVWFEHDASQQGSRMMMPKQNL